MKKFIVPATGLAAFAAAAGAFLATAAPATAAESAAVTIGQLEAQGFDVKVDRVGSAPLDQCEVTAVRNPRVQRSLIDFDDDNNNVFDVERRTITVSLNCSR